MKTIIIAIFLFAQLSVFGQLHIDKTSIDNGGAINTNAGLTIIYTIGEPVVQESNKSNIYISEGFLSPDIFKTVNTENFTSINDIKVFPNPTVDIVNISFAEKDDFEISISNSFGQLISKTKYYRVNSLTLNLKNFIDGIYFILIKNSDKMQYKTYKIVKQK